MGRGFFFNIHIYIYIQGWVGGFLTLYSVAVKHPETGLGCKAIILPTVTNFNLHRFPLSLFSHLGCKLNSFLVFKLRKQEEEASTAKPPRGRLRRMALSYFSCC